MLSKHAKADPLIRMQSLQRRVFISASARCKNVSDSLPFQRILGLQRGEGGEDEEEEGGGSAEVLGVTVGL